MLLSQKSLEALQNQKNLLAFSAGVDSSALFFILLKKNISFDIALVNYNTRESSKDEANHAKKLAIKYNKNCYIKDITLLNKNFEHNARKIRYDFFEDLIQKHNYKNLITAHHLNDKLEWFLMQLTKGAGLVEMLGFDEIEDRKSYKLIRPLIDTDKDSLQNYLDENNIDYFIDESNFDPKYKRNIFRHDFSNPLLKKYKKGIQKSFQYLKEDKDILFDLNIIEEIQELVILKRDPHETTNIRQIDKILKYKGYILSKAQKDEVLNHKDIVISDKYVIAWSSEKIYISPYLSTNMDKKTKELYRKMSIPPKIRPYLHDIGYQPKINQQDTNLQV